mgnify:FL=1|jgi:hypothetical protein
MVKAANLPTNLNISPSGANKTNILDLKRFPAQLGNSIDNLI